MVPRTSVSGVSERESWRVATGVLTCRNGSKPGPGSITSIAPRGQAGVPSSGVAAVFGPGTVLTTAARQIVVALAKQLELAIE